MLVAWSVAGCGERSPQPVPSRPGAPDIVKPDVEQADLPAPPDVDPDAADSAEHDTTAPDLPEVAPDPGPPAAPPAPMRLGTWNLRNFSIYGIAEFRIDAIAEKIVELDADVLGLQEIKVPEGYDAAEPQAWDALLEQLPGYEGIRPDYHPTDTVVGLLYRPETVTLVGWETIYEDEWYAFPRDPLVAELLVERGGGQTRLFVIVVHLKAFGDSVDRRREACAKLSSYIESAREIDPSREYAIVGDFNDDPYDPPELNAFAGTFLDAEPAYYFVTHTLPPETVTSLGWFHVVDGKQIDGEFLDHGIMTGGLYASYETITPEVWSVEPSGFDEFDQTWSDHFPVVFDMQP